MPPSKLSIGSLGAGKFRSRETGYQLVVDNENQGGSTSPQLRLPAPFPPPTPSRVQFAAQTPGQAVSRKRNNRTFLAVFIACCVVCGLLAMAGMLPGGTGGLNPPPPSSASYGDHSGQSHDCPCRDKQDDKNLPDYFRTKSQLMPGPTQTGKPAFLAQTAQFAPTGTASFVPNEPLQTAIPIQGMQAGNRSIFEMMGFVLSLLSPTWLLGFSSLMSYGSQVSFAVPTFSRFRCRRVSPSTRCWDTSGANAQPTWLKISHLGSRPCDVWGKNRRCSRKDESQGWLGLPEWLGLLPRSRNPGAQRYLWHLIPRLSYTIVNR